MSRPSNWPLPPESFRYLVPRSLTAQLAQHPLSADLYPRALGFYAAASGHRMQRESHDDYLMIYCLEGKGRFSAATSESTLEMGDLLIVPAGLNHRYAADPADPWTIYWTHFEGLRAAEFALHTGIPCNNAGYQIHQVGLHAQLISDFEALMEARNSVQELASHIYAANQLRQILSHIALLRSTESIKGQRETAELERVHSLMRSHLHEKLDLDTLAAAVNLSKFHFVKRYRELSGTTPINRFIQLKIERACHLLDTTDKEIKEVAYAVGYDDAYYFSRIFRKQLGISPSQYRASRT